jgi:hypothetical protein
MAIGGGEEAAQGQARAAAEQGVDAVAQQERAGVVMQGCTGAGTGRWWSAAWCPPADPAHACRLDAS